MNTTFQNLEQIGFKQICFESQCFPVDEFKFVDILSKLPSNINVMFGGNSLFTFMNFTFDDCIIKIIQKGCKEPLYLDCKQIIIQIDFNNSESCFFIPKESKPIETELFFHVASVKYISFVKIKKIDNIKEVKLIEQYFLEENVFDQCEIEFIIPFSKLKLVKSLFPLDLTMVQNEDTVYLIKELSRSKKVEWSIDLNDGLENIELCLTHLPSYCYYNIDCFSNSSLNILSFKNTDKGFLLFSKIKLNELKIFSKISAKELILIKNLLELENIKNSLQSITINTQTLIEALEILDLCTECKEIQSISLSYSSACFSKIVVTKKIKNAKRKLCSKVGFINKFSILQV